MTRCNKTPIEASEILGPEEVHEPLLRKSMGINRKFKMDGALIGELNKATQPSIEYGTVRIFRLGTYTVLYIYINHGMHCIVRQSSGANS